MVLPEERRQQILLILHQEGKVTAANLSDRLGVSEDTIRRDLKELDQAGRLTRVHGGALPRSPALASYQVRQTHKPSAKEAIARAAVGFLRAGQTILIDGGTTTLEVARHLPLNFQGTVITTSPPVLLALSHHSQLEIIMVGGRLDTPSMTVTGSTTYETLSRLRADVCLLGVCSLHEEIGVTAVSQEEAALKRLMIHNAADVIAVATDDKLGTAAPFVVTPIDQITHIVTESGISRQVLAPYLALGIEVIQA